jgi:hypothetical protein
MADFEVPTPEPLYLWLLTRSGAFLHREYLWEDSPGREASSARVSLYHLVGNLILSVRFLESVSSNLSWHESSKFRIFIAANNVQGRSLHDENSPWHSLSAKGATTSIVSARIEVGLSSVLTSPHEIVVKLIDEMAWQFGRHDLKRQDIEEIVRRAPDKLGAEYRFGERRPGG